MLGTTRASFASSPPPEDPLLIRRLREARRPGKGAGPLEQVTWWGGMGGGEEAPRPVLLWPLVFVLLRNDQPWALLGICSSPYLECSFPCGDLPDDFRSTLSVVSSVKPSLTAESWWLPPPCSRSSRLSFVGMLILQTRVLPIRGLGPGSYPLSVS